MNLADIMTALDAGSNMFGALAPDIRARLFAVLDNPTEETWNDAHSIIVDARGFMGTTLWQALLAYTDYQVNRGPVDGGHWEQIPTQEQIATAVLSATS